MLGFSVHCEGREGNDLSRRRNRPDIRLVCLTSGRFMSKMTDSIAQQKSGDATNFKNLGKTWGKIPVFVGAEDKYQWRGLREAPVDASRLLHIFRPGRMPGSVNGARASFSSVWSGEVHFDAQVELLGICSSSTTSTYARAFYRIACRRRPQRKYYIVRM